VTAAPGPIRKIVIANRGEIAVRVARTVREMGIGVVAVYSDPDRSAPHVRAADEAYALPGETSAETYLRGEKIIAIAQQCGAQAVHPGYGFLSENAAFAEQCAKAGIIFIGPSPAAIRGMGDKIEAKKRMAAAGVPVVPGWASESEPTLEEIEKQAQRVGFPLLIKAAAGGGGKGMRVVTSADQVRESAASAMREAQAAFGDGRVFIERYIPRARHVEIQIMGDTHGNVVHLFERECSIQRRHQKIVEESPSPGITPALRQAMGEAAVRGAQAIGYAGAGTFEFMLEDSGNFYFLEVNTRLQVEHPVTEAVTGWDLVRLQVMVASGAKLPFTQNELTTRGHAIECRLCAEDPARGFLPSTGKLHVYEEPHGPGIRVDSGVCEGGEVSVHYDPMLAKIIVSAPTRDAAIARMIEALRRTCVLGVTTNARYLRAILEHEAFTRGATHTKFLEEHAIAVPQPDAGPTVAVAAALALATRPGNEAGHDLSTRRERLTPWSTSGGRRFV